MGNCKALIGKTRFSAGLFLSKRIANRKLYASHLKFEEFSDFQTAEQTFFKCYPWLDTGEFKLNKLYPVKERPEYCIYYTREIVLIGEGDTADEVAAMCFNASEDDVFIKTLSDYEEAQVYARNRFVRYWKNSDYFIPRNLRIGVPVYLKDIQKSLLQNRKREVI